MKNTYELYLLGDSAITIQFGNSINEETNNQVLSLLKLIKEAPFAGVKDLVPAYASLTIVYDPKEIINLCKADEDTLVCLERLLTSYIGKIETAANTERRRMRIPVCYHTSLAPDIEWLAETHHLTVNNIAELHHSVSYLVYMIGFLPGFPYMATVDERIATPRKPEPRSRVEAGSVGIAGNQTGIYPFASPGGWQIIGRTPLQMFNAENDIPSFVQPGDEVLFYPISLDEFNRLSAV